MKINPFSMKLVVTKMAVMAAPLKMTVIPRKKKILPADPPANA